MLLSVTRFIGIDNGLSGAIAALTPDGRVHRVEKMPTTDGALLVLLEDLVAGVHPRPRAVLEFAQAFPGMGVSSAFTYGGSYRAMQMALLASEIAFDIVVPRVWQAVLGCLSKGDKTITKRRAEQLFPTVKITHSIADALLIAEYCRRFHCGIIRRSPAVSRGATPLDSQRRLSGAGQS